MMFGDGSPFAAFSAFSASKIVYPSPLESRQQTVVMKSKCMWGDHFGLSGSRARGWMDWMQRVFCGDVQDEFKVDCLVS